MRELKRKHFAEMINESYWDFLFSRSSETRFEAFEWFALDIPNRNPVQVPDVLWRRLLLNYVFNIYNLT